MKKGFSNITLILILSQLLMSSCSINKKRANDLYIKAKEFSEKQDYNKAILFVDSAIAIDTSNLEYIMLKSSLLRNSNNYNDAINILMQLKNRRFKEDTVNYKIGLCFNNIAYDALLEDSIENSTEAFNKAMLYIDDAIKINIRYYDAYILKAKLLYNLHNYYESIKTINKTMILFPNDFTLILIRGVAKITLGDLNGAFTDLNNAIESKQLDSSQLAEAYRFIGNIHSERKNIDESINYYTLSLNYDSTSLGAFISRGNAFEEKGLKEKQWVCVDV